MLNAYRQQTQRFLRDSKQTFVDIGDIDSYINRARREIAMRTQCVRVLTPVCGSILNIQVTAGGSGYTAPTVSISTPDFPNGSLPYPAGSQATALAQQIGGVITNLSLTFGGDGYFQPTVTIDDPTGSGATAVAYTNPINVTQQAQEIYNFSDVPLSQFPGIGQIIVVKSVSIIFSNLRYSLPCYSFSTYQAKIRNYPFQYQFVPCIMGQYGQGANGSLYMYPIPSQPFQMEWDTFCTPADLSDDSDYEAVPMPWQDAIPIGAAVYAFEELQALNNARYYQLKFDDYVHRYSTYARPGRMTNPYGRY